MFEMNHYTYKAKKELAIVIDAREQKTADEIIDIVNKRTGKNYKPARFRFVKPFKTAIPPYNLEREQKNYALKMEAW